VELDDASKDLDYYGVVNADVITVRELIEG